MVKIELNERRRNWLFAVSVCKMTKFFAMKNTDINALILLTTCITFKFDMKHKKWTKFDG